LMSGGGYGAWDGQSWAGQKKNLEGGSRVDLQ
jgi:hypothetical protein